MQTKGTSLHVAVIVGCFLLARALVEKDRQRLYTRILIVAISAALSGTGWYFKNWYVYGNPLYPFQITLPGIGVVLFSGERFDTMVVPAASGNYRDLSLLWLYLSHFAGISYQPGWGVHFFFFGLPATALTIFRNRNLT